MKKKDYWLQLPTKLRDDLLDINFGSTIRKDKAIRFIHILRNKAMQDNYDTLKFIELSASWFKGELSKKDKERKKKGWPTSRTKKDSNFGGRYKEDFLDLLILNKIIEVKKYSVTEHRSNAYRISEKYFNSTEAYSSLSYSDKCNNNDKILFYYNCYSSHSNVFVAPTLLHRFTKKTKKYSFEHFKLSFPSIDKNVIYGIVDSLNIDYVSIMNSTKSVIDKITVAKFKVDDAIEFDAFEVYNRINNRKSWMTKQGALLYVRKAGLSLIQDKEKMYIDDLDRYVETKKKNIYSHYMSTIEALKKGIYHVDRNNTNFRLDTIFTSMCSDTLDIIKRDNNLVEIDLVNSQFAILANWLLTEDCCQFEDVKLFCSLAIEGGLYEYIAAQLHIERKQAKKMMMSICFSSHRFNSELKRHFKNLFPNVHEFIQSFKKQSSESSDFAVELQKRESKLFIDGIFKKLVDENMFVLTKHDSLIVKREDEAAVLKIIDWHFQVHSFKAKIKVE